jgi:hypothetical protein
MPVVSLAGFAGRLSYGRLVHSPTANIRIVILSASRMLVLNLMKELRFFLHSEPSEDSSFSCERHSLVAEASVDQPLTVGIYVAQCKRCITDEVE